MTIRDYFDLLLDERKTQNEKVDFTVDYCRLLCMVAFKDEFDDDVFNELAANKEDNFMLFKINEDKEIVFNGDHSFSIDTKYEREESDFYVEQFCEADELEQLHSRICVDGHPYPIKKTLALLGLSRNAFYKKLSYVGDKCKINGHVVERVYNLQTKINKQKYRK